MSIPTNGAPLPPTPAPPAVPAPAYTPDVASPPAAAASGGDGAEVGPPSAPPSAPPVAASAETAAGATAGGEVPLPTQVSAAWELELLIAGAVTFALVQLPPQVEALRMWLSPRFPGRTATMLIELGCVYTKAALYALIAGFVVNLAARAYWVGLVGLHSVYPRGVQWDALKLGPIASEVYRKRLTSLPAVIARVDNFASVIFSFTFLIAITVALSVFGLSVLGTIGWGVSKLAFAGRHAALVTYALFALPLVVLGIVTAVDKKIGARLPPDSPARRRIARALHVTSALNGSALVGPITYTLMSNGGRRRMSTFFFAGFLLALGIAMTEFFTRYGLFARTPAYVAADDDLRGVHAEHYESLTPPSADAPVVSIQSDVIEGPYVRLFVPLLDDRVRAAMTARCPRALVEPTYAEGRDRGTVVRNAALAARAADARLACLSALHPVTLDGAARDPGYRFYRHPETGVRGLVAYLPTAGLAPGMHTLTVARPPRDVEPGETPRAPELPLELPFWK